MSIDKGPTDEENAKFGLPESGEVSPEVETAPTTREVWMVEDSKPLAESLMRAASSSETSRYLVVHFQEGEAAIDKFKLLIDEQADLPEIILMDYELDQGVQDPKYKTGVEVLTELKRIAADHEVQMPNIVAFTTDNKYGEELIAAGADSFVNKRKDGFKYMSSLRK